KFRLDASPAAPPRTRTGIAGVAVLSVTVLTAASRRLSVPALAATALPTIVITGEVVPPTVLLPLNTSAPPVWAVTVGLASEPVELRTSEPALIVVAPPYVLAPERTSRPVL